MTFSRRALGLAAVAGALGLSAVGGVAAAEPPSAASGSTAAGADLTALASGTPGFCPTRKGVTVVVDFNELGGGIVVRCAPGPVVPGYTGLDAMQDAGFAPTGTQRWGMAFICRIAGKPAPDQRLHIDGDRHYKEACIDTPPVEAYWSYWYAPNAGSWTFSVTGPTNRDAIPGGFEGWSFSLNHEQGAAPPPGIAPKRPPHAPPTTPPPTHTPPSSPPSTSPPPTHPPTSTPPYSPPVTSGGPSTAPATSTPHTKGSGQTGPLQSGGATSPSLGVSVDPVAVGHNAAGEKVSGTLPGNASTHGGSAGTAVVGLGIVAVLAAGGGFAAWRRRGNSS